MWSKSKLEIDSLYFRMADGENQLQVIVFLFKPAVLIYLHCLNFAVGFVDNPEVFGSNPNKFKFRDQSVMD